MAFIIIKNYVLLSIIYVAVLKTELFDKMKKVKKATHEEKNWQTRNI